MGGLLDKPKTEKTSRSGEANGLRYGVSAMQGWRMEMEDSDVCNTSLEINKCSFFGVFDGHAGSKVSNYCSNHLWECIMNCLRKEHPGSTNEFPIESIKKAMYKGFLLLDEKIKADPIWANGQDHSGSTAIVVFISPTHIIWGNCGDSRSVFCRKNEVFYATEDHKPGKTEEKERIEKAGGTVLMQRVNGTLAVSRALGDFAYKRDAKIPAIDQLVSPEPDIKVLERNLEEDEFVVLACDGIYDVMSNQEVVEFVRGRLEIKNGLSDICNDLIDTCLHKNSRDNMSVVIVTFPAAPKVSQEAIQKNKELQEEAVKNIEMRINELVEDASDPLEVEENHVFELLVKEMPLSYEVVWKRSFIIEYLQGVTKTKFRNIEDFVGSSDPINAPSELQFSTSTGTPFVVKGIMSNREDDEFDSFDDNLLKLDPEIEETNTDKMVGDGEEQMEVTTQGEETKSPNNVEGQSQETNTPSTVPPST